VVEEQMKCELAGRLWLQRPVRTEAEVVPSDSAKCERASDRRDAAEQPGVERWLLVKDYERQYFVAVGLRETMAPHKPLKLAFGRAEGVGTILGHDRFCENALGPYGAEHAVVPHRRASLGRPGAAAGPERWLMGKDYERQYFVAVGLREPMATHKPLKLTVGLAEVMERCCAQHRLLENALPPFGVEPEHVQHCRTSLGQQGAGDAQDEFEMPR